MPVVKLYTCDKCESTVTATPVELTASPNNAQVEGWGWNWYVGKRLLLCPDCQPKK